ncbi:Protein of uncharacterised function (DUF2815) [Mycobacteroides abscessus subsp. abscessus]|nr:Protein of uncharacterised function (DUF2815) [Mycobacteroides abscessus subsp. abscessus]
MTPASPIQPATGNVHLCNVNVFEAKLVQRCRYEHSNCPPTPNSDPMALTTIERGFVPTIDARAAKFGAESPNEAKRKFPLRDGHVKRDHDACARSLFVNTSSAPLPQIMRADLKSRLDSNEGCRGETIVA